MHGPTDHTRVNTSSTATDITSLERSSASGVGGPDLVRPLRRENSKPVRRDRPTVAAVGSSHTILGTLTYEEALYAHEYAQCGYVFLDSQALSQSRAAIGLSTAHKDLSMRWRSAVLHLSRSCCYTAFQS